MSCSTLLQYSITSSASARSLSGMARASAFSTLGVKYELEPGGLLDWNVGRAGAAQNLVHMRRRAVRNLIEVGTVAQERALARPGSPAGCEQQPVAGGKGDNAGAVQGHQARRDRYQRLCADAQRGLVRTLKVGPRPRLQ